MARLMTLNNASDSNIRITNLPEWPTQKGRVSLSLLTPRPTKKGVKRASMKTLHMEKQPEHRWRQLVGQAPAEPLAKSQCLRLWEVGPATSLWWASDARGEWVWSATDWVKDREEADSEDSQEGQWRNWTRILGSQSGVEHEEPFE